MTLRGSSIPVTVSKPTVCCSFVPNAKAERTRRFSISFFEFTHLNAKIFRLKKLSSPKMKNWRLRNLLDAQISMTCSPTASHPPSLEWRWSSGRLRSSCLAVWLVSTLMEPEIEATSTSFSWGTLVLPNRNSSTTWPTFRHVDDSLLASQLQQLVSRQQRCKTLPQMAAGRLKPVRLFLPI